MSFSRQITGDVSGRLSPQSAAAATDPLLVERCILLSRTTVGTALSNAKCTSRRRATPEESGAAARGPCWLAGAPVVVAVRPLAPLPDPVAAQDVQICHKGQDRAGTPEENR